MEKNYDFRFEFKPGKFIYVPTDDSITQGQKIVKDLLKKWSAADYFYHFGKRGGHVAAMRPHIVQSYKASIDLKGFFSTVTRTKVQRALRSVGYSNRYAFDLATESCVESGGRKFLPYGFVQSMALATLVVEKSKLGSVIVDLRQSGVQISMYVDDIILSCGDKSILQSAYEALLGAIVVSNLTASPSKSALPASTVVAFNSTIFDTGIKINSARMAEFKEKLKSVSTNGRLAILSYVGVIDDDQKKELISF
ncbi:MAG: reverse transcriptase domain-containing protein [Pseudomonadota bacterium]